MSRIGKKPIIIPPGLSVRKNESGNFIFKGPKGELVLLPVPGISVSLSESEIVFTPSTKTKKTNALWGLARALFANAVQGVSSGFEKKLQIEGVGYRGEVRGEEVHFALGFSHPVIFSVPKGITVKIEKNIITISGVDKMLVGEIAARIRALKKPEPYKGKGIRFVNEIIKIKAGKKAVGTATG